MGELFTVRYVFAAAPVAALAAALLSTWLVKRRVVTGASFGRAFVGHFLVYLVIIAGVLAFSLCSHLLPASWGGLRMLIGAGAAFTVFTLGGVLYALTPGVRSLFGLAVGLQERDQRLGRRR